MARWMRNLLHSDEIKRSFGVVVLHAEWWAKRMSETECKVAKELTQAMEKTMQRLQGRFQAIAEHLEVRIDEMGTRISCLEENVTELMTQAGMDEQPVTKETDVLPQ
ncbi:heat shock factor-binding protein 1-like protein 1 [Syngnathus typhle]|uniref:heat shock factor-binding protein 1-like protein 1 n=1 Tax=Syngnathus typhle TaxID=161592 RepID=UPI002A6A9DE2|nr:heat shock factor-binding protein 1-like protein 1 [Syngnathus typhle]